MAKLSYNIPATMANEYAHILRTVNSVFRIDTTLSSIATTASHMLRIVKARTATKKPEIA